MVDLLLGKRNKSVYFILRSVFTIFDLRPKIGCASAKEINLIYFILRSVFTIFVSQT